MEGTWLIRLKKSTVPALLAGTLLILLSPAAAWAQRGGGRGGQGYSGGRGSSGGQGYSGRAYSGGGRGRAYFRGGWRGYSRGGRYSGGRRGLKRCPGLRRLGRV